MVIFMNIKDLGGDTRRLLQRNFGIRNREVEEEDWRGVHGVQGEVPPVRRVLRPAAQGHAAAGHAGLHGRDDRGGAEEVSKCEKAAGKFKLVDLLTVPMQRILKYHMLLQRLVGQTHASHEEYHSIEQAYNCIINVSEVSL